MREVNVRNSTMGSGTHYGDDSRVGVEDVKENRSQGRCDRKDIQKRNGMIVSTVRETYTTREVNPCEKGEENGSIEE